MAPFQFLLQHSGILQTSLEDAIAGAIAPEDGMCHFPNAAALFLSLSITSHHFSPSFPFLPHPRAIIISSSSSRIISRSPSAAPSLFFPFGDHRRPRHPHHLHLVFISSEAYRSVPVLIIAAACTVFPSIESSLLSLPLILFICFSQVSDVGGSQESPPFLFSLSSTLQQQQQLPLPISLSSLTACHPASQFACCGEAYLRALCSGSSSYTRTTTTSTSASLGCR